MCLLLLPCVVQRTLVARWIGIEIARGKTGAGTEVERENKTKQGNTKANSTRTIAFVRSGKNGIVLLACKGNRIPNLMLNELTP